MLAVCVCVLACVHACVSACVCAHARVCVRVCLTYCASYSMRVWNCQFPFPQPLWMPCIFLGESFYVQYKLSLVHILEIYLPWRRPTRVSTWCVYIYIYIMYTRVYSHSCRPYSRVELISTVPFYPLPLRDQLQNEKQAKNVKCSSIKIIKHHSFNWLCLLWILLWLFYLLCNVVL